MELEIVEGPGAGRRVPLDRPLELGRGAAATLRLDDAYVAEAHARVVPVEGGALVEDLGDPGGTFVNDAEVATATRVGPGDEIQLGVTVLVLHAAGEPASERAEPPPLAAAPAAPDYLPVTDEAMEEVEALLDARTKSQARTAPLALFVLVVFAVLIFLATAKL